MDRQQENSFSFRLLLLIVLVIIFMPTHEANGAIVTNTGNTGVGSLHWAIGAAQSGDTVLFDPSVFPPSAPVTINQTTNLPIITQGNIIIDASNAGVILDGGGVAECIVFNSSNNTIMGVRIQNCIAEGILISGGTNNIIGGNNNNGSGPSGEGNVIVSNGSSGNSGIVINSTSNKVYGNYIGTDGSLALGNFGHGIVITGASNIIGGTGQRNIISGNGQAGIGISSFSNIVQNNYIGTDSSGTLSLPNLYGVLIGYGAKSNTIGGTTAATRNVISGNTQHGVLLLSSGTNFNVISGNYIGTDATGLLALGNNSVGVLFLNFPEFNTIGGTEIGMRNIISGNSNSGVYFWEGGSNNTVLGNYIGTDVNGIGALGNAGDGVTIENLSSLNTLGGTVAGSSNIISGNTGSGIRVTSGNNTVLGNYIGTNSSNSVIPNGVSGIAISGTSTLNLGSNSEVQSNIIGPNTGYGIYLDSSTAVAVLAGTMDVNDDVRVSSGTLNMGDATINLSGNWTKSGGTINAETSTVILDGSSLQTITTNDSNFNNLTVTNASTAGVAFTDSFSTNNFTNTIADSKMIFTAGQTYTIDGSIVLQGASGQLQTLESSTGTSPPWNLVINDGATKSIDYVNVSWSDASGSHATHKPIFPTNSTGGGNNIDWFGATNISVNKISTLISDPFNGTGAGRNHIPGAIVEYSITTTNSGNASPDDGTVIMTDVMDSNVEYEVGSIVFKVPNNSGLTLGTITYSQRSAPTDYIYTPVGPFDPNVAGIKITTNGTFNHTIILDPDPSFTITYSIRIK